MAPSRATARQQPVATDVEEVERQKSAAATVAAGEVRDGMRLGLGTGSTVVHLLRALGGRHLTDVRCVATSPATELAARAMGLTVCELDELGELDLAIDGADQVDPAGWLVKGGGAALTREKIVAAAARRFVVIVSAEKTVRELEPPVPLEVLRFGVMRTLATIGDARVRAAQESSPDGNAIADYLGPVGDPRELSARLSGTPGVVEHGLFAPELVSEIVIARQDGVEHRAGGKPAV
ncbi:MAG TPA: ribose-5-phosphate isomerase RpiA [Solirubrobacteraceae bacterium]|jgi:ribose 5-phosphate isomerase A